MKHDFSNHCPDRAGFSLSELLMTLAILGVLCGLAMGFFGGNMQEVELARDQRNAQSVCLLCQSVQATGTDIVSEANSALEVVQKLVDGVKIKSGVFKGKVFRLPGLPEEEQEGAARYLTIEDGELLYDGSAPAAAAADGKMSGSQI